MAISARNKLWALVKSPSLSQLLDLEVNSLFKWQGGCFQPYNVMHVLFAPATLLSGSPFFPCSPSTVVRPSFRGLNMSYCPSHFSADLTMMSCHTGLWQTHISYLHRKDQPKSCYICITFLCKLWCVQKGPWKWQELSLDQHWAPAASTTFKGSGDTSHTRVPACGVTFALRQRGSVRKFPFPKPHGRIHPGLSPQWGEQHTFI